MRNKNEDNSAIPFSRSLNFKVLLTTALLILIVIGSAGSYILNEAFNAQIKELNYRANLTSERISSSLIRPLWDFDEDQIAKILFSISKDKDFVAAAVIAPDGNIIASYGDYAAQKNYLSIIQPLNFTDFGKNENLGDLVVYYSSERLSHEFNKQYFIGIIAMLTIMGAILFCVYLGLKLYSKPLQKMRASMISLSQGRLNIMIPYLDRKDEIGMMAKSMQVFKENAEEVDVNRRNQERHRIFRISTDLMCILDSDGYYHSINPVVEPLLGFKESDMIGKSIIDFIHPQDRTTIRAMIEEAVKGSEIKDIVCRHRRHDGSYIWISFNVIFADGSVYAIGRDITKQKQTEQALIEARDIAEKNSKVKSEFLANMSHEIRTPMNGVLGMTEILSQTDLTSSQKEYVAVIKSCGESLMTVINDVLDFSKLEAGKLSIKPDQVDIRKLAQDIFSLYDGIAKSKNLTCDLVLDNQLPKMVLADGIRIRQVLSNLITNAIKFTESGNIHTTIKFLGQFFNKARIRFEIKDTGIGVAVDKQKYIFEKFTQADSSSTRSFGGTGLGLAICKQLVQLMDGEIGVTSAEGHGSTFWFELDLIVPEQVI